MNVFGTFTPCNEFYETGGLLPSPKDLNVGKLPSLQREAGTNLRYIVDTWWFSKRCRGSWLVNPHPNVPPPEIWLVSRLLNPHFWRCTWPGGIGFQAGGTSILKAGELHVHFSRVKLKDV